MKHFDTALISVALASLIAAPNAFALEQIIRPYQSVRAAGMGNVRYTTGLYDENFFANPARSTADPTWRIELFGISAEVDSSAIANVSKLTNSGGDTITKITSTAGSNNHARIQTSFPSIYLPIGTWSFNVGVLTSTQADVDLRKSYNVDPTVVEDVEPVVNVAKTFFDDNSLSVGVNAHASYRLAANKSIGFADLIQGTSTSVDSMGGQGLGYDADVGATYVLPFKPLGIELQPGLAINNILGGKYDQIKTKLIQSVPTPSIPQDRMLGFGIAASYKQFAILENTTLALEFSDIGHNTNGSMWRTVHLGAETHLFGLLMPRVGINQGYPCLGVGLDLKVLTIDAATYGEEMGLNPGDLEDRRYALNIQLQI